MHRPSGEGLDFDGHLPLASGPLEHRRHPRRARHVHIAPLRTPDLELTRGIGGSRCRAGRHDGTFHSVSGRVHHLSPQDPGLEDDLDRSFRPLTDSDGPRDVPGCAHLEDRAGSGPLELDPPVARSGADLLTAHVDDRRRDRSTQIIERTQLEWGGLPEQRPSGPNSPDDGERDQQTKLSSTLHARGRLPVEKGCRRRRPENRDVPCKGLTNQGTGCQIQAGTLVFHKGADWRPDWARP